MNAPPQPPVGQTVATALLELLKLEGVAHIFGVPGGALVGLLAALKADGTVVYHTCRQETGAAYMGDGYARAGGGLGVVLVTSGPGATNAVTGAMNADASHTPLLVITGEVPEASFGQGYLQEGADARLDVVGVYDAALDYSELIAEPANLRELFTSAMRHAWGTPRHAAHLSLPNDIGQQPFAAPGFTLPPNTSSYRASSSYVDAAAIEQAVEAVAAAERPLLMIGNLCRSSLADDGALASLQYAVDHLSLPVMTSPDAKGIFPESHDLSLRNYGIAGCQWPQHYLTDPERGQYDALLCIGSSLGGLATTASRPFDPVLLPNGPLIHIHEDPTVLGRTFPMAFGVVGETGAVLQAFAAAAASAHVDAGVASARRQAIQTLKTTVSPFVDPDKRSSDAYPIKPQALARLVAEAVPAGGHVVVDAGNCVGWCLHEMVIDPPTRIHSALAMGPMGFATAAVVGMKLAAPASVCIAVSGDGGFVMQVGEVATAAQYGVGAIWVVLGDHDLTMVSQGMAAISGDPSYEHYYAYGWMNLATVAQGLGAAAFTADSVETAASALEAAIAGAAEGVPQVVVVEIDGTEMPPYHYPPPPPH